MEEWKYGSMEVSFKVFQFQWLNEFPYRESIHWFLFPLAGFAFLILAVMSVGLLTRKAATANPVSSLRAK